METDLVWTVDKFTFRVPQDRLYSRDDCWVRLEAERARIGLTDFRQQAAGDVAFIELPPVGSAIVQGEEFMTIETMKVTLGLVAPLSGTISAVNPALADRPELLNQDPYGEGWLVEVTPRVPEQVKQLLSPDQYFALMQGKAEAERSKQG